MFHWICPECGREIPPEVSECLHRDPQPVECLAVTVQPVESSVEPPRLEVSPVLTFIEATAEPVVARETLPPGVVHAAPADEVPAALVPHAVAKETLPPPLPVVEPGAPVVAHETPPPVAQPEPVEAAREVVEETPVSEPVVESPAPVAQEALPPVVAAVQETAPPPLPVVESVVEPAAPAAQEALVAEPQPVEAVAVVPEVVEETPVASAPEGQEALRPVVAAVHETAPPPLPVVESVVEPAAPAVAQEALVAESQPVEAVEETPVASAPEAQEALPPVVAAVHETAPPPLPVVESVVEPAAPAVAQEALVAEPQPVEAVEETPVAAAPVVAQEALPPVVAAVHETAPPPLPVVEPVVEPAAQETPVAQAQPVEAVAVPELVEETPVAVAPAAIPETPVIEPVAVPEPVAVIPTLAQATPPLPSDEPEPLVEAPVAEPVTAAPQITPAPIVYAIPMPPPPAAVQEALAAKPVEKKVEPQAAEIRVAEPQANESEPLEAPDPLLVLAEEIRAAQAAHVPPPPEQASGLAELAGAVQEHQYQPDLEPVEPVASVQTAAPEPLFRETAEAMPQAVALATETEEDEHPTLRLPAVKPEPEPEPQAPAAAAPIANQPKQDGPALPVAPLLKYTPATMRSLRPVPPPVLIVGGDAEARITLPGPALPADLVRLQNASPVTNLGGKVAMPPPEKAKTPAQPSAAGNWLVSGLVALVLTMIALGVVYFLILPRTVADAKPAPAAPETAVVSAPSPAKPSSSPLGKFIEVTGIRIVMDGKKSELQYLVVNHSDADISDANVQVTLRGARAGQPPVCRFSFKVPSLGPYEAKEMSSPIEKARALTLPDWQELRTDVQVNP